MLLVPPSPLIPSLTPLPPAVLQPNRRVRRLNKSLSGPISMTGLALPPSAHLVDQKQVLPPSSATSRRSPYARSVPFPLPRPLNPSFDNPPSVPGIGDLVPDPPSFLPDAAAKRVSHHRRTGHSSALAAVPIAPLREIGRGRGLKQGKVLRQLPTAPLEGDPGEMRLPLLDEQFMDSDLAPLLFPLPAQQRSLPTAPVTDELAHLDASLKPDLNHGNIGLGILPVSLAPRRAPPSWFVDPEQELRGDVALTPVHGVLPGGAKQSHHHRLRAFGTPLDNLIASEVAFTPEDDILPSVPDHHARARSFGTPLDNLVASEFAFTPEDDILPAVPVHHQRARSFGTPLDNLIASESTFTPEEDVLPEHQDGSETDYFSDVGISDAAAPFKKARLPGSFPRRAARRVYPKPPSIDLRLIPFHIKESLDVRSPIFEALPGTPDLSVLPGAFLASPVLPTAFADFGHSPLPTRFARVRKNIPEVGTLSPNVNMTSSAAPSSAHASSTDCSSSASPFAALASSMPTSPIGTPTLAATPVFGSSASDVEPSAPSTPVPDSHTSHGATAMPASDSTTGPGGMPPVLFDAALASTIISAIACLGVVSWLAFLFVRRRVPGKPARSIASSNDEDEKGRRFDREVFYREVAYPKPPPLARLSFQRSSDEFEQWADCDEDDTLGGGGRSRENTEDHGRYPEMVMRSGSVRTQPERSNSRASRTSVDSRQLPRRRSSLRASTPVSLAESTFSRQSARSSRTSHTHVTLVSPTPPRLPSPVGLRYSGDQALYFTTPPETPTKPRRTFEDVEPPVPEVPVDFRDLVGNQPSSPPPAPRSRASSLSDASPLNARPVRRTSVTKKARPVTMPAIVVSDHPQALVPPPTPLADARRASIATDPRASMKTFDTMPWLAHSPSQTSAFTTTTNLARDDCSILDPDMRARRYSIDSNATSVASDRTVSRFSYAGHATNFSTDSADIQALMRAPLDELDPPRSDSLTSTHGSSGDDLTAVIIKRQSILAGFPSPPSEMSLAFEFEDHPAITASTPPPRPPKSEWRSSVHSSVFDDESDDAPAFELHAETDSSASSSWSSRIPTRIPPPTLPSPSRIPTLQPRPTAPPIGSFAADLQASVGSPATGYDSDTLLSYPGLSNSFAPLSHTLYSSHPSSIESLEEAAIARAESVHVGRAGRSAIPVYKRGKARYESDESTYDESDGEMPGWTKRSLDRLSTVNEAMER